MLRIDYSRDNHDFRQYINMRMIRRFEIGETTNNNNRCVFTIFLTNDEELRYLPSIKCAEEYEKQILDFFLSQQSFKEELFAKCKKIAKEQKTFHQELLELFQSSPPTQLLPDGGIEYQRGKADFDLMQSIKK